MPRFFLHIHDLSGDTIDEEGRELPDITAARAVAVEEARESLVKQVRQGELCLGCYIDIMNDAGNHLTTVTFDEAVSIRF